MRVKTAVILAGGKGTRMRPFLATPVNKHLTPVVDKAMIYYPIATAVSMGVSKIFIMLNGARPGIILEEVGSNINDIPILYHYDKDPVEKGPAAHIAKLDSIVSVDEPFLLILGDSIYRGRLPLPSVRDLDSGRNFLWAMPIDKSWDDISKYAQIKIIPNGRVIKIMRSSVYWAEYIQTGAWIFQPSVIELTKKMLYERESELRITDLVSELVNQGNMYAQIIKRRSFVDAGTPCAVKLAEQMLKNI